MRRKLAKLAYWFESRLPRGAGFQLAFVLLALAALTLAGGLALQRVAGNSSPESFWWAFLRLSDPGYLGEDSRHGPALRLLSTLLSLAGNLLLTGAMVAIFTTALDRYLGRLERGRGRLVEDGHFLILGWNERIPALVEELLTASARLGLTRPSIAILSPLDAATAGAALKRRLHPRALKRCRLLLRTGDPLEREDLLRMDFPHARALLLVASGPDRSTSDLTLAKIVLMLKTEVPEPLPQHRATVVEVASSANKRLAESVGWPGQTQAIVTLEIIGRLLAQSVRNPGITDVYAHLLTDTFGESLFFVPAQPYAQATLRELVARFPRAVPLGFVRADGRLILADLDAPLEADSRLVMMATSQEACQQVVTGAPLAPEEQGHNLPPPALAKRVLVCGWNAAIPGFLTELAAEASERFTVTLASDVEPMSMDQNLRRLHIPSLTVDLRPSRLDSVEDLASLEPGQYDSVVVVGRDDESPWKADAETVMRCVLLQDLLGAAPTSLVVELKDEDNRALLSQQLDVLVTDQIVSHLLAQVAIEPDLLSVFEELFTRGGAEIQFESLLDFTTQPTMDFAACQAAALARQRLALGWRLASERTDLAAGLHLNPPRNIAFQPERGDVLVSLAPGR